MSDLYQEKTKIIIQELDLSSDIIPRKAGLKHS